MTSRATISRSRRLDDLSQEFIRLLNYGDLQPPRFAVSDVKCETTWVAMRDGIRLATDLYLPPLRSAPVVVVRTPYGRSMEDRDFVGALLFFARRGYVAVSQDCRGTGGSEPDSWDYYMHESEDGYDCIDWIRRQSWFGGFIGSFGGSYVGQTQWAMALHPAMSCTVPGFSGLGIAFNTAHFYMFLNAYARTIGKGESKVAARITEMERLYEQETMAGGYFNDPLHRPFSQALLARFPDLHSLAPSQGKRWLWEHYCALSCAQRAAFIKQALGVKNITSVDVESLPSIFGHRISHDAIAVPHADPAELCRLIKAPPLLRTGWYDWCLNDAFATWGLLRREAHENVAERARMIITPYAHNLPGYHEGVASNPELMRAPSILEYVAVLLHWYETVRAGGTDEWPRVIYYLMGANEWQVASDWPVPEAQQTAFYLGADGSLTTQPPTPASRPDQYSYDPYDPTPTVGGSIVSFIYPPGSVDVSAVQRRPDVLAYTTPPMTEALDVVGPLRLILYASSSALDTDFVARLSDVFPDGRAIQLQSGILRARYRNADGEPALLEPGRIYRYEIEIGCTANRFKARHCLRLDISSADFPKFDRNSNRGGSAGDPVTARQTVYRDSAHPSHLLVSVLR